MTKKRIEQFENLTTIQQKLVADLGYAARNIAELSDMILTGEYILTEAQMSAIAVLHKQAIDLRCETLMAVVFKPTQPLPDGKADHLK